jgi:hypothetical protein
MKKFDAMVEHKVWDWDNEINQVIVAMFPISPVTTIGEITADLTKAGLSLREIRSGLQRLLDAGMLKRKLLSGRYLYSSAFE